MNPPPYRLFFSARTHDQEEVEKLKNELRPFLKKFHFVDCATEVPRRHDWQAVAAAEIENCDGMICVVSDTTHESPHVNWEIEEASRRGKPVIATTHPNAKLPSACEGLGIKSIPAKAEKLADKICTLLLPKALLEGNRSPIEDVHLKLLETQYNAMFQSWEALISRRQTVVNVYLTASALIFGGVVGFLSKAGEKGSDALPYGAAGLAVLGIFLTGNWYSTLHSYGQLSQAKSDMVSALESYMPAKLFDIEWVVLERKKYQSTTAADKRTAGIFFALFVLLLCGAVAMAADVLPKPAGGSACNDDLSSSRGDYTPQEVPEF